VNLRRCRWILALTLLAPAVAGAQTPLMDTETEGAVISLEVQQDLDRRMLQTERQRYLDLLRRRRQASRNLDQLYTRLDEEYERLTRGDLSPDEAMEMQQRMTELELMVQQFEMETEKLRDEAWLLRDRMREKGLRLALLGVRINSLKNSAAVQRGPLTGRWTITLLPRRVDGTVYLRQKGTLLSGQYTIGANRSGSFTGTVIGGRITMQQIDSEFGKDAVYYGTVMEGGNLVEGTWESLHMGTTGRPGFGTWKAVRVPAKGEEVPEEPPPGLDKGPVLPQAPPQQP